MNDESSHTENCLVEHALWLIRARAPDAKCRAALDAIHPGRLTHVAEHLGDGNEGHGPCCDALLHLSRHASALVREGAVMGMAKRIRKADPFKQATRVLFERMRNMSNEDPSGVIRDVAREHLEEMAAP